MTEQKSLQPNNEEQVLNITLREKLIALSIWKNGDWDHIYWFLKDDPTLERLDEEKVAKIIQRLSCDVMTLIDDDYPHNWREMSKPPFVLYLQGNRQQLTTPILGIIGCKNPNQSTKKMTLRLATQLPDDMAVINGLEIGTETLALEAAHHKIAILASGFKNNNFYQNNTAHTSLTESDLQLSERPPHAKFDLQTYYRSYHLIYELSDVICVFEMPKSDIRLKYLRFLTEIGKPVFVLPAQRTNKTAGGLQLLNHGANCLLEAKDILKALNESRRP